MKLNPRIMVSLAFAGAVAFAAWRVDSNRRASAPVAAAIRPPAKPDADGLARETDPAAVFERAFWRRPTSADKILHAERRDWLDASSGVEKWQWFIAIEPSAAFRDALLKDNPFELVAVPSGTELAPLSSPPTWFPPASELAAFTRYRNREGRFFVFHDTTTHRLYTTDAGGGFAVARK